MKITDKMRLDFLAGQDRIAFTGLSQQGHGDYVRFSERFSTGGLRRAIDRAIRASKPKKGGKR